MHLWPSLRIRESFKFDYLKKLEWNLKRMENESPTNKKKLLKTEEGGSNDVSAPIEQHGTLACCRDLLIILSCCYCCFCCGGNPTSSVCAFFFFWWFCWIFLFSQMGFPYIWFLFVCMFLVDFDAL